MTSNIRETLEQERAAGFPRLAGSRLSARVPLRESFLNATLTRVIARQSALESLHVSVLPANRLRVAAGVRVLGFRKMVKLEFHIQPVIDDTTRWEGVLAFAERTLTSRLLVTAAPIAGALPPGVTLADRGIIVQLHVLLSRFGGGEVLPHLVRLLFETEEGTLWVSADVEMAGDVAPESSSARTGSNPAKGQLMVPTLDEVQSAFHGAMADIRLRIAAPLVNALLAAGLDDVAAALRSESPKGNAAEASAGPAMLARVRPWLEHHFVSFEEGAMVVDAMARVPQP